MKITLETTNKAFTILKEYKGTNPYIISLKNKIYAYKDGTLNDFHIEYIIKNHDKEPLLINKIIKISKWYGEKKQMDWECDFLIEKLLVSYYFGETDTHYHCMVKYRQSVDFQPLFIPKSEILNPLFQEDYLSKEIDFQKYNEKSGLTLKPHQERSVKFLTTCKKGILSLQMGAGKSLCAIVAALEDKYEKILVVCPASLKTNWKNELIRFVPEEEITIVEGSKWKENKWTILNYDILKNFYTVPKETKKVKEKGFTEDGEIEWKTVEKTVKTNKKEIVAEALSESQIFQSKFDLIIIDEAHRLSNKTSNYYQIFEDLIKRSNPKGIYELTGTMIKNDTSNLFNLLKLIGAEVTKDWVGYHTKYCSAKQIFRNRKERDYYSKQFITKCGKTEWKYLTWDEKQQLDDYLAKNCKKIWIMGEPSNLDELRERIKHLYYRELNEEVLNSVKVEKILKEYHLTASEYREYNNAWNDYIDNSEEKNVDKLIQNHKLIEGAVFRQILADFMIPKTIKIAEDEIASGNKVIIFCCFDKELYTLQEYFGNRCVIYNGKMTAKTKDKNFKHFKENDDCKVFIGNLQSASVGLNLNEANAVIFNTFSFVPSDNEQAEFRCLRINQNKDVKIYYQVFSDTYLIRMQEILQNKNDIIKQVITEDA